MIVISQNIPGWYGPSEIENKLHELISRYKPTVLCVNEVKQSVIQSINLPDYTLVRGQQTLVNDCRTNLFVKNAIKYEVNNLCCDSPVASIKIGELNIDGYL